MSEKEFFSGIACLQALFGRFRRNVNFEALLTDSVMEKVRAGEEQVLIDLALQHDLAPEKINGVDALSAYNGPVLAEVIDKTWVLLLDSRQMRAGDKAVLFAPSADDNKRTLSVPVSSVLERLTGNMIIFRKLAQIDSAKQTRLFAFSAIASHHNSPVDIREIMHEYAVGEEEVRDSLFRQIASDYKFKSTETKIKFEKLESCTDVFPCIARKKNDKFAVLCGVRRTEENGPLQMVILDPESENVHTDNRFLFLTREEFEANYSGKFILLKKNISTTVFPVP